MCMMILARKIFEAIAVSLHGLAEIGLIHARCCHVLLAARCDCGDHQCARAIGREKLVLLELAEQLDQDTTERRSCEVSDVPKAGEARGARGVELEAQVVQHVRDFRSFWRQCCRNIMGIVERGVHVDQRLAITRANENGEHHWWLPEVVAELLLCNC